MKKRSYSTILLVIFLVSFNLLTYASAKNNDWISTGENPKVFIENKGQFTTYNPKETVLYAYDDGSTMIYFTPTGITYRFLQAIKKEEEEKERERKKEQNIKTVEDWKKHEEEENKVNYNIEVINFNWENANADVQVIALNETPDYHSYALNGKDGVVRNINHLKAFKKLIYKNIYPNIDIEYVFHPEKGIKYTVVLHPGADVSQVKMKYDNENLKFKKNGDLLIPTVFGNLIDHAPVTFYADNTSKIIPSHFVKNGAAIVFELGTYDPSKTVLIDPWVQTPTLSNSNSVWECEKDGAGNVYIIGGDTPMRLRKYNSAGTMQWTYNTPWDTANGWLGTFATDLAGNSYVTNGTPAALQKINPSGAMLYSVTGGGSDEYWNITFNCDQTKLIVGGSKGGFGLPPNITGAIYDINTSNGSVTGTKIVGYGSSSAFPPTIQEVRSISSSRNAKYYFITLDTVGYINQDFTACSTSPPPFKINHTYHLSYKSENYHYKNCGIKAIKANKNFVYTQNGTTIHKRSLATGAIIGTATISGGISVSTLGQNQVGNSGIDIDSCGNVYVGSGNAVIKYDANLTQLSSVAVPFKVYDVAVSYNGDVIVCGTTGTSSSSSRTGYVQSINMTACDPMILFCCNATVCPVPPYCTNDAPVTLSPVVAGGTWSGPGITNASTGTFSPSVAGPGVHTIIYTLACGSDSVHITVTCCGAVINPVGSFCMADAAVNLTAATAGGTWTGPGITSASSGTFSPSAAGTGTHTIIYTISGCGNDSLNIAVGSCVSLTACQETNGDITATSGTAPYNWYNQTTTQDCSTCAFGCSFPPGCAVNTTSWVSFSTGTTITPSGTYPVLFIDAGGDSLQITSLSSLPACTTTSCPTLTVTASAITAASCAGQADGSFSASTSGGASPWDYTLVNSGGTTVATFSNMAGTQSFTGLLAGVYTLNVLDNAACPGTTTVTITEPTATITAAAAGPDQTICSSSALLAGNTPTAGTGVWTLISGTGTITTPASANSGVTGLGVGTIVFEWTISDACSSSADQITITNTGGGPAVAITSQTNVSCNGGTNGSATASATGGTGTLTYLWAPSGGAAATATNLQAGTYTISVTDNGNCTGIETVTLTEPSPITASVSTTPAGCSNDGTATVNASGGSGTLNYLWSVGGTTQTINNLNAGSYSVDITDSLGCTQAASGTITSTGGITAGAGSNDTIIAGSSTQLTATGGGTYLWTPSTGLDCDTCTRPVASPEITTIYCVTATDMGCSDSACVMVIVIDENCGSVHMPTGSVYVPTAFSPNNDVLNDVFKPVSNCVHDYQFTIFDRWGEKIFETTDTEAGWNGYYKGSLCKPDVYVYKVSYVDDPKNNFHQYIGRVTLLK
ncbi:MAG: T9SS type B sorting domain-containing protein [Bacteroidota bacterium]